MALSIVQNNIVLLQQISSSKEGEEKMNEKEFRIFLDDFIRSHYNYKNGSPYLDIDSIDNYDLEEFTSYLINKQALDKEGFYFLDEVTNREEIASLFSSYILSHGEKQKELKEDFLTSMLNAAIESFKPKMQELVDERISDIWHEDMYEMGAKLCYHKDNNEPYYIKR